MSQIPPETMKVVLRASGKELRVRLSTNNELNPYLVDENGKTSETDSGIKEKKLETFMVEHFENGEILVSFYFRNGDECYLLKVDGKHLQVRRAPDPSPNLKFEKCGTSESYTLRTVDKNPQYLYVTKNPPFVLKLDSSERVMTSHTWRFPSPTKNDLHA